LDAAPETGAETGPEAAPVRGGPQHIPRPARSRPGDPPPWAGLSPPQRRLDVERLRRALVDGPPPAPSPAEGLVRSASAVLAPVYEHEGQIWLVFTRRAWHLRSHRGEVSFPGGRQEPGETLWETALREAWEEIDLDRSGVQPLGELDHLSTVTSRSFIVPYVGLLPGRPDLEANEDEVDAILHVPVSELLDPAIYRQELWEIGDVERPIHFFELVGDTLWGATASVLVDLLGRVAAR
jgi:8-oxo-dGTP pyrophosphatase MutT (NUDIX family)